MNRKTYLQIVVVLIGAFVACILALVVWLVMIIPVMIRPSIVANFQPFDAITKRMIKGAMRKKGR